ncbi:MAG: hypothetical protein AB8G05_12395 [Oligoflexales bacterium]
MTNKTIISYMDLLILTFLCLMQAKSTKANHAINSLIFIIHEDGFYDYFDGNKYKSAAKESTKKAKNVAHTFTQGEVFIFRQKPVVKNFFQLAKKSLTAYYYSGGELISKKKYHRENHNTNFEIEFEFYNLNSQTVINPDREHMHVFYYFGKPIPEIQTPGYSKSVEHGIFSAKEFFGGLAKFTHAFKKKFDALILASGYGSTPGMVEKSIRIADYYIASSGPLSNVSYELTKLAIIDNSHREQLHNFLKKMVDASFSTLKSKSVEEVGINLYEGAKIRPLLKPISKSYKELLAEFNSDTYAKKSFIDCSKHPSFLKDGENFFQSQELRNSIYKVYRKAYYGWSYEKIYNSGWACPIYP